MTSFRKAQKVVNIRRNPKVSLLAESGSAGDASAPDLLRRQAAKRVAIRISRGARRKLGPFDAPWRLLTAHARRLPTP